MASYRELVAQRDALQKQIDAAKLQEVDAAIEKVRAIIAEFSLTYDQVFSRPRTYAMRSSGPRPAKYRDPATGATWSGVGRTPLWLKGRSRDHFLIRE